ncbi:Enterobactin outer-membrane receptor [Bacteroidales bacterium Barb4]|nr:Enterobactin outer-membrane receptor [Bacteroidales bacterium Barb4]
MKENRKSMKRMLVAFVVSLLSFTASTVVHAVGSMDAPSSVQQRRAVTGTVIDAQSEPVIGANVIVEGEHTGTVTDANGAFSLDIPANATLRISYIGYLEQTVTVGNRSNLVITLKEDWQALDEVVVVGYGTMKKRDLTGAVSSVKMSDSPVATVSTISHALAGKAAGLQVNTISAQPGGEAQFRIRGAASTGAGNDPLIIVDGFPVSASGNLGGGKYENGNTDNILASINPNDIESIEVLKDASSTAIYGARAGNGVIIITTKKGSNGAPKVQYSGTASVQRIARKYDMLSASDFMTQTNRYTKEDWMRVNKADVYGDATVAFPEENYLYSAAQIANPANSTDWFDEVTRAGFQTQHNVSINGGNEHTKYLVSGNFFNQEGVLKNNSLQRYTGRVNLEQKLSKYVKTGINLTLSRNKYDNVPLGSSQNENAPVMVAAAQFSPILAVKDGEGNYNLNTQAAFLPNPVSLLDITDNTTRERVLATAYLEIEPIKDLKLKGNFGIDRNYQKRGVYMPKTTLYGQKEGGRADINQSDKSDYLMELTAAYVKQINDHSFSVVGGYSFQSFNYERLNAGNNQFLIDGFLYNNIGAGGAAKPWVGSTKTKDEMASFFGRINYTFKDRYLLTATFRADGASNFAENNRWGYFPSVALGWRFLDEAFAESLKTVLSNGKLRASYGETGNSNIGNRAISYYQVGNNNEFGDTESKGVYLSQMGNPDIKWETTKEWNFGMDLGFFNSRLNVTAEYFDRVVSGQLASRSLLSYHELSSIAANIGDTQSRGFELTLNTVNVETSDFSWNTDFTFSFYRDKWKKRDATWKPAAYSIYNAPLRGSYGYLSDGLVQAGETVSHMPGALPGQVKIKDIDGFQTNADGSIAVDENGRQLKTGVPDGKLNDADRVFYGSDDPGYLVGLNNTLRWKNFDFNFYLYGQLDKSNAGSYLDLWLTNPGDIVNLYRGYNMPVSAKDVWTHDNPNAPRPGYFQSKSTYGIADFYRENIWFVRCRNITLGYTVPSAKIHKIFSNLRVYADITNPFVLTPYKGLDPETDNSAWAYPNVRSYNLGLEITF